MPKNGENNPDNGLTDVDTIDDSQATETAPSTDTDPSDPAIEGNAEGDATNPEKSNDNEPNDDGFNLSSLIKIDDDDDETDAIEGEEAPDEDGQAEDPDADEPIDPADQAALDEQADLAALKGEDKDEAPKHNFDKGLQHTQQEIGNLRRDFQKVTDQLQKLLGNDAGESTSASPGTATAKDDAQALPPAAQPKTNEAVPQTQQGHEDLLGLLDGKDDNEFIEVAELKTILARLSAKPQGTGSQTNDPKLTQTVEQLQKQLQDLQERSEQANREQRIAAHWNQFATHHRDVARPGEDPIAVGQQLLNTAHKHVTETHPQYEVGGEGYEALLDETFNQLVAIRKQRNQGAATTAVKSTSNKGKGTKTQAKASRAVHTPGATSSSPGEVDQGSFDLNSLVV